MYPNEWYGAAAKTGEERSAQQWITDMGIFYSSCHKVLVVIHIDGTTCRNNLNHCKARLAINQWIRRKALSNPYQRQHHHQRSQAQSLLVNQRKKFFFDNFIDNSCRAMSADVANYVRRAVSIWDLKYRCWKGFLCHNSIATFIGNQYALTGFESDWKKKFCFVLTIL